MMTAYEKGTYWMSEWLSEGWFPHYGTRSEAVMTAMHFATAEGTSKYGFYRGVMDELEAYKDFRGRIINISGKPSSPDEIAANVIAPDEDCVKWLSIMEINADTDDYISELVSAAYEASCHVLPGGGFEIVTPMRVALDATYEHIDEAKKALEHEGFVVLLI